MKKVAQLNYYEILNIESTATKAEIQQTYSRLRKTYQPDSLAIYSIVSNKEREEIVARIENAYSILMDENNRREYDLSLGIKDTSALVQKPKNSGFQVGEKKKDADPSVQDVIVAEEKPLDPLCRDYLKNCRERMGISLKEISASTNISLVMLIALENGEYEKLPGRTYALGFLRGYAKFIGVDLQKAHQNMEKWAPW